ncbi:hypothetical protein PI95_033060 [Hassallia byssoidea VB512170]|uniref:Uncharacterized protein n=1 Tax=Hassallia byssoidea VB512170 TaxID=1304833 RepID=A0A846HI70_9CYAN|nr:hypothetical protein [Hassalia byssoidea]NEU77197.1 hypothetical protein [Hassalia byssoidea VB512170]
MNAFLKAIALFLRFSAKRSLILPQAIAMFVNYYFLQGKISKLSQCLGRNNLKSR